MCKKQTVLVSASTSTGGVPISALMMSCGTDFLALIIRDIIETRGLSRGRHPFVLPLGFLGLIEGPHISTPYSIAEVTSVSKSQSLVRGS